MGKEDRTGRQEAEGQEDLLGQLMEECQNSGFVFKIAVRRGRDRTRTSQEGTLIRFHAARFEPTPDDPLRHIKYPDGIPAVEAEEIVNLQLWASDFLDQNDRETYSLSIPPPEKPDQGDNNRLPLMGIINPMSHLTLSGASIRSIAHSGGVFTVSPQGLQIVTEQPKEYDTPLWGSRIPRELIIYPHSSAMARVLDLTTGFINEGFTAATDVSRENFSSPAPGFYIYLRASLNRIGYQIKNGFPDKS